jgi:hypothetical protein
MSVSTRKLFKIFNALAEEENTIFETKPCVIIDKDIDKDMDIYNNLDEPFSTEKNALPYLITVPNHDSPLGFNTVKPLAICLYYVHTSSSGVPFLLFLLHKDKENIFSFISLPSFDGGTTNKHLIRDSILHIESLFNNHMTQYDEMQYGEMQYGEMQYGEMQYGEMQYGEMQYDARYAGFCETATKNIIILRLKNNNIKTHLTNTAYMWATSFEIFNTRHLGPYAIDDPVFTLFIQEPAFLFVYNKNGDAYETPTIGYSISKATAQLKDVTTMDIYREYKRDFFPKSYYIFKNMPVKTNATQHIMRLLIFVGNLTLNVDDYINAGNTEFDTLLFQHEQISYYVIKKYIQHMPLSFM